MTSDEWLALARLAWVPLLIAVAAYVALFVLPARDDRDDGPE